MVLMDNLTNQPDFTPSRKVAAMTMAVGLWECIWIVWANLMPSYASVELKAGLTPLIGLAVGYLVRDEANVVVQQDVVATDIVAVESGA